MIDHKFSAVRPEEVEAGYRHNRQMVRTINFHITTADDGYEYDSAVIPPGHFSYGGIINELVTSRYPDDVMAAVINNYLADPADVDAKREFDEMQRWRREAKEIASASLSYGL